MMMMAMMMMMMTVMMTHRHFGSRSSFAGGQADFKVDEVRAISEDSPTIRDHDALARRLGRLVDCILERPLLLHCETVSLWACEPVSL